MVRANTAFSYMPGAEHGLQRLDHLEPAVPLQSQDQPLHLDYSGHKTEQYPTHHQRVTNTQNRLPRLWNVKDYPIDVSFGNTLIDVINPYLQFEVSCVTRSIFRMALGRTDSSIS